MCAANIPLMCIGQVLVSAKQDRAGRVNQFRGPNVDAIGTPSRLHSKLEVESTVRPNHSLSDTSALDIHSSSDGLLKVL